MKAAENKILLSEVNQFITCVLCKGYLIDATTITECLHTFCKTCIVEYLEENTNCPICDTLLHQSHPLLYISYDRTLQSIVYKLVKNLERNELERQIKFYDEKKEEYPQQLQEKLEHFNLVNKKNQLSNSQQEAANLKANEGKENNQNYHRNDEQITLSLEPLDGLKELDRKFILCSCHSTITHLKKFVAMNIYSSLDSYKDLEIVCNDEVLGKDHTLKFINVTKWKNKELPMRLNYRPKLFF